MSEQTKQALDNAVAAHATDEWNGDLVVDWIIVGATIDPEGVTGIGVVHSREPAPTHVVTGLLHEGLAMTRSHYDDE